MKNKIGGKNFKKGKKKTNEIQKDTGGNESLPLSNKDESQLYAQTIKRLGGSRLSVKCSDGIDRQAIIPGSFYKKVWINAGDILLIQLNSLSASECFVLYKYVPSQSRELIKMKEIEFNVAADNSAIDEEAGKDDHVDGFDFGEL